MKTYPVLAALLGVAACSDVASVPTTSPARTSFAPVFSRAARRTSRSWPVHRALPRQRAECRCARARHRALTWRRGGARVYVSDQGRVDVADGGCRGGAARGPERDSLWSRTSWCTSRRRNPVPRGDSIASISTTSRIRARTRLQRRRGGGDRLHHRYGDQLHPSGVHSAGQPPASTRSRQMGQPRIATATVRTVSGTVGGSTYGVAKGVSLVAVRVLDCGGSGSVSGVIAGVDWVTANAVHPAVANMSLGGGLSATLNAAVRKLHRVRRGLRGGGRRTVRRAPCNESPSSAPTAITVAASDSTDALAWFSNFGSCVDIIAPGVNVKSAWIGSNSATNIISGTSMATPHVTGAGSALSPVESGGDAGGRWPAR